MGSWAKLSHEGRPFWLFSSHWCLEAEPMIITVDANSHMDGHDRDAGVRWLLSHGFEIAGKGPMAGGIDYMFVSQGHWRIGKNKVGPTEPSDHPSFTVKLTLTGTATGALPEPAHVPASGAVEGPDRSCAPFGEWPHVDGVTCGG